MSGVNWGLGTGNNALAMFQQGAQMGSQMREQREREEYRKQQIDIQRQQGERQQAEFDARRADAETKAQEAARVKMGQMARLFAHAEKGPDQYAQARGAARQLFGDAALANIPEQFDANWTAQQRLIVEAMGKDPQAMVNIGRELQLAGIDPESEEGQAAARRILEGKYGAEYVDQGGAMRRQRIFDLPEVGEAAPEGVTFTPIAGGPPQAGQPPFSRLEQVTMMAESGGNPNAVSPKGARGLMQVMPGTARDPGFGISPSDGSQADDVRVGKDYLRAMQRRYGGDLRKMWAAYNAGPGRVDAAIRKYGENWLAAMPAETRAYVARTTRAAGGR